jgi:hypothetical protein
MTSPQEPQDPDKTTVVPGYLPPQTSPDAPTAPPAAPTPPAAAPGQYTPPAYTPPAATPSAPPQYQPPVQPQAPQYQPPAYTPPQQPGYQQGGYQQPYQQPGYPSAPAAKKKGKPLPIIISAVVLVAALVVLGLGFLFGPKFFVKTKLSHTAVESYIGKQFSVTGVSCGGGSDIEISSGDTFTCSSSGGTFTVTFEDGDGKYSVAKTG